MTISQETETFFNKPVAPFTPGEAADIGTHVYRLALEYEDTKQMVDLIDEFFAQIDKSQLDAIIIGNWGEAFSEGVDDILAKLIANASELPNLRAVFIGDMTFEECEISWITQGNYTPLINAFPKLEALRIRGSTSLTIEPFTHQSMRSFIIECGGLPQEVAIALAASSMPNLTHLELWLGTDDYGFSGDADLYRRVLAALMNPNMAYLGLRDAQIADDVATMLATQESIANLKTLDLSLGTIGDIGAEALCKSPYLAKLETLDLSHHYISEQWQDALNALPMQVILDDEQGEEEDEDDRYVAVGE